MIWPVLKSLVGRIRHMFRSDVSTDDSHILWNLPSAVIGGRRRLTTTTISFKNSSISPRRLRGEPVWIRRGRLFEIIKLRRIQALSAFLKHSSKFSVQPKAQPKAGLAGDINNPSFKSVVICKGPIGLIGGYNGSITTFALLAGVFYDIMSILRQYDHIMSPKVDMHIDLPNWLFCFWWLSRTWKHVQDQRRRQIII